jgi:hypothetical protein
VLWSELHRLWKEAARAGSRTRFTTREIKVPDLVPAHLGGRILLALGSTRGAIARRLDGAS